MSCGDDGKSSWPELVGEQAEVAKSTIEKENSLVTAVIVYPGCPTTRDFRCDRVFVYVDCGNVVESTPSIDSDNAGRNLSNILHECREVLNRDWDVKINHVFREQNRVADVMAKMARQHGHNLRVFDTTPTAMITLVREDAVGTAFARTTTTD